MLTHFLLFAILALTTSFITYYFLVIKPVNDEQKNEKAAAARHDDIDNVIEEALRADS